MDDFHQKIALVVKRAIEKQDAEEQRLQEEEVAALEGASAKAKSLKEFMSDFGSPLGLKQKHIDEAAIELFPSPEEVQGLMEGYDVKIDQRWFHRQVAHTIMDAYGAELAAALREKGKKINYGVDVFHRPSMATRPVIGGLTCVVYKKTSFFNKEELIRITIDSDEGETHMRDTPHQVDVKFYDENVFAKVAKTLEQLEERFKRFAKVKKTLEKQLQAH